MVLLSVILMLVVGAILMGLFWKLNWLKIVKITTAYKICDHEVVITDHKLLDGGENMPPSPTPEPEWKKHFHALPPHGPDKAYLKIGKIPHDPDKAYLKIDEILDFEIPKWMADRPFNYAICFLIICCGLAIILFPLQYLLVKL